MRHIGTNEFTLKDYLTTYRKVNKAGHIYYTQQEEHGIKGDKAYELIWSGRVKKENWDWCQMIAKEQPHRLIVSCSDMICIIN